MDENRPLAAAMCFDRLSESPQAAARLEPALSLSLAVCWMRAGKPDEARQTLGEFRRRYLSAQISLKGQPVKLFAGAEQALPWLAQHFGRQPLVAPVEADQWVVFRGDESRNAPSSGGQPLLSLRWRQRTCDDSAIEQFVAKLQHDYLSQDMAALPSMHPLAVADVVLMRTAFALEAVDFATGKLVWRYSTGDESLEQFLRAMGSQQANNAMSQLLSGLDTRMWNDLTYGTLASDGRQVYSVEELDLSGLGSDVWTVLPNGHRRNSVNTRDTNRLAARELRTQGKLKWSVGGVTGEDEPKLAGVFFLGPPLPLMGYLYALAEVKGQEIRLVALSPETGALEWSQQLAVVDPPISFDEVRRTSGATPSFADGVLVCPTAAGAVVGIDLSTRSLLWGYQYPRLNLAVAPRFNVRGTSYVNPERRSGDHWADTAITIAGGHVLVTPTETDEIYCLNLADGKELWKQDRGTHLYVACVHDGKAYLVGQNSMSVVNLADGTRKGQIPFPEGALPSGRGFYSGHYYYLPLSTAEVAKVNLDAGRVEDTARSRSGSIPGNLICYRDSIISQGADYLDAYYQLDALKDRIEQTLAEKPDDPQALAALGEIKLDEKELGSAVDLFRRSYALEADPATRVQLVEGLLAGLRSDFAAYRQSLDELEQLIQQPRHRIEFLRFKAAGLQLSGEVMPAFETYLQLVDEQAPWETDDIDENLSVRRDRWIRATRATALGRRSRYRAKHRRDRSPPARRRAGRRLGRGAAGVRERVRFAAGCRRGATALVDKLSADELLEQNQLLQNDILSNNDAVAGPATARMAQALDDAGQHELAAVYFRQLNGRFANVTCLDGQTGRQLFAALADDDLVRTRLAGDEWPTGRVTAQEQKLSLRGRHIVRPQQNMNLEIVGARGPLFQGVNLAIVRDAQQHLVADDGLGRNRFRVLLSEQGVRRFVGGRSAYNIPSISYASVHGGLVVLSMGTHLMAIDTMRPETPWPIACYGPRI